MATLRNKTTDSGVIVRWVPHPDHNRPSTYQVRSSAVDFLVTVGYAVPSPGDEVEIPWDVCRPLRVLGDLHFKSEQAGVVDTGGIAEVPETYGQSLTNEQRQELRTYIESHQNYGTSSDSLRGELEHLPEQDLDTDTEDPDTEDPDTEFEPDSESPDYVGPAGDVLIGVVDRISSSDNAMFEPRNGKEWNMGPLDPSVDGERVVGVGLQNDWAFCLNSAYWTGGYLEFFADRGLLADGLNSISVGEDVEQLFERIVDDDLPTTSLPDGFDTECEYVVELSSVTDRIGIGELEGHLVWAVTPFDVGQQDVRVRLTGASTYGLHATPHGRRDSGREFEVGDAVTADVVDRRSDHTIGTVEHSLVRIPGVVPDGWERIHVGISGVHEEYVEASVDACPPSEGPQVDDRVTVSDGKLVEYPDVPLQSTGSSVVQSGPFVTAVVDVGPASVECSVRVVAEELELSPGDVVTVQLESLRSGCIVGQYDGIPFEVESETQLWLGPAKVEVVGVTDDAVQGMFLDVAVSEESTVFAWNSGMVEGFDHLRRREYTGAVAAFERALDAPTKHDSVWAIEARANRELARAERARDEGHIEKALRTVDGVGASIDDGEGPDNFGRKMVAEFDAYVAFLEAVKAYESTDESAVRVRRLKASVETKRQLKEAVAAATESSEIGDENLRSRVHPVVSRGTDELAAEFDAVPNVVADFRSSAPYAWEPILSVPDDAQTSSSDDRVVPFEAPPDIDRELRRLRTLAEQATDRTNTTLNFRTGATEYRATPEVVEYVRARAEGVCEACSEPAPFEDPSGRPYLELHHIAEFETTGVDTPESVVALCPNCHSQLHHGRDGDVMNDELSEKLEAGLGSVGT